MKRSTLLTSVVAFFSLNLLWMSVPAVAQHGGGHGGGGGGHAGGGGGFHGGGGSYGGYHGGGGGYGGGYHGGAGPVASAGRGPSGGMRGRTPGGGASANAGRPWSWEGHSSRNSSPGWHQFASGGSTPRAGTSIAARSGESSMARAAGMASHAPVADGNWHSFNAGGRPAETSTRLTSVTRSAVFTNSFGWRGNYWGGWHGGWGWHGWGWPGWNWGFGWGWGCCGWGWGWNWGLGFGWGWGWWGPGWSAWGPFWAWPPYYYDPWMDNSWLYGDSTPAPYVLDPYPA